MAQPQVFAYIDDSSLTSQDALELLGNKSQELGLSTDASSVYEALLQREEQGTTAMVSNVSLPHAQCSCVGEPAVVVVRFEHPVSWNTKSDTPSDVSVAICLLMPKGEEGMKHLKNLSKIAAFLSDEDNLECLVKEENVNQLRSMIADALM